MLICERLYAVSFYLKYIYFANVICEGMIRVCSFELIVGNH